MLGTEINVASKKQQAFELVRELPRDLMIGLPRLKEKKETYLPRNPTEVSVVVPGFGTVDPWANRVNMSRLNNMFAEAVGDASGRAFAKPAKPMEGTPDALVDFLADVDGIGSNFQVFGKEVATTSFAEGVDYVLVDHPTAPGGKLSAIQERSLRLAPFWKRYSPANVLDWKIVLRGREARLVYLKLREWADEDELQVRLLFAGDAGLPSADETRWARFEVWRPVDPKKPDAEWFLFSSGPLRPQTEIPFVEFPSELAAPFCARPPFLDLAHLTIAHYRKTSDLDNAQHAVGFPVLALAGFRAEDILGFSSSRALISGDAAAKAWFVEPEGKTWASLRIELDKMEAQGRAMSSQLQMDEASIDLTATGAALRASGSASWLESRVLSLEDGFARLFRFTAIFLGIVKPEDDKGWGGIELNRQFIPNSRNIEGARLAHERNLMGKLSNASTHAAFNAAEIVTTDWDSEKKLIDEEGLTAPTAEDRGGEDLTDDEAEDEAA